MKSKLVFALLSLFICSACLGPAKYLSVVPTTLSKGHKSDYTFHFTIEKQIQHSGSLFIQFPKQYTDFTNIETCLVRVNGGLTQSGPCTIIVGTHYTSVVALQGIIEQGSYIVSISYILNPDNVASTSNFRIYSTFYNAVVEESADFEGMAFVDAPSNKIC